MTEKVRQARHPRGQAPAGSWPRLLSRIRRDEGYLAYRKACNRHTRYDDEATADLQALALAAMLLDEEHFPRDAERTTQRVGQRPGRS
ncbi:MAG TPA: hypothetical protein VGP82_22800 [Ktedonobacterales bacterium]|nr:hypothetical protein [Ktedonobacterales bacterium]